MKPDVIRSNYKPPEIQKRQMTWLFGMGKERTEENEASGRLAKRRAVSGKFPVLLCATILFCQTLFFSPSAVCGRVCLVYVRVFLSSQEYTKVSQSPGSQVENTR